MSTFVQSPTGAVYQYDVPQTPTGLVPEPESLGQCEAGCQGLPTTAYLACIASCREGIDVLAGDRNPSPLPDLGALAGQIAGAGKWLIVGLVAIAVIRVAGIVR